MTKLVWDGEGVIAFQIKEGMCHWDVDQNKLVFLPCDLIGRAVDADALDLSGSFLKCAACQRGFGARAVNHAAIGVSIVA